MKERVHTDKAAAAIGPYSQAVLFGNLVMTSGQVALTPQGEWLGGSIEEQTRRALDNLQAVLEAAGTDLDRVVKTTVFLADMSDFDAMNAVYAEYFTGIAPARSCVQVARLPKGALVEIEALAELH